MIFQGKFQSLNQLLIIDIMVQECYQWKAKCSIELNFSDVSWKVDGMCELKIMQDFFSSSFRFSFLFLDLKPFFGPTYLNFYDGVHKHIFYGKILLSIETEEINEKLTSMAQQKQDILMPINESDYWNEEIFKINMVLISLDSLNSQQSKMKAYLSCKGDFSNTFDIEAKEYGGKVKLKFVQFEANIRPLLTMLVKLPDHRTKNQMKNLVQMLVDEMVKNYST